MSTKTLTTQCPNCAHKFTHAHQIVSLGSSPAAGALKTTLHTLPQFRDLLSDEAKKVYDVKIPSVIVETIHCEEHDAELLLTEELREKSYAAHLANLPGLGKKRIEYWDHQDCENLRRHCHMVAFMCGPVSTSFLNAATNEYALQGLVEHRLKVMAHIVNRGVAEGWLAHSVMMDAFYVDLAVRDMKQSVAVNLFITSRQTDPNDFDVRWLDKKVGVPGLFVLEGELGCEEPWYEYAKAHGL